MIDIKRKLFIVSFIFLVVFIVVVFFRDSGITGGFAGIDVPVCDDCNVIFILIDTLRADHVGAYGYGRNTTPNIDKLAENGIVFTNMLAQSSWTKPAMASFFTGLYPKNHGANNRSDMLADDFLMFSEILKDNGYDTHAFVANPSVSTATGFNQGYGTFEEILSPDDYSDTINEQVVPFIEQLDETSKQFIYIHYMDPHNPYVPREEHFSLGNDKKITPEFLRDFLSGDIKIRLTDDEQKLELMRHNMLNLYDDEILFNDKMVGEVIDALGKKGMYNNSLVIVVSDHGEEFYEHKDFLHGTTLYNEQLLVPWIMYMPNLRSVKVGKSVNQIDFLPTILPILGISTPDNIDGVDVFHHKEVSLSFAELDLDHRKLFSVQTPKEKLISGIVLGDYFWVENSMSFNFKGDTVHLPLISFFVSRPIEIILNGNAMGKKVLQSDKGSFSTKFNMEYLSQTNKLQINSLVPCTNLSEFGFDDNRCLSFGLVGAPSLDEQVDFQLIFGYYLLENDSLEQHNGYVEFPQRVNKLSGSLQDYLNSARVVTAESAQFNQEQLEALKALGYIN